jgi:nucleotide-binding universal stress UspA family protein
MSRITRLLVPTDFSATSEVVLNYALEMAAANGATVHLLHVIDNAIFTAVYPDAVFVELPGVLERITADAQARLDEAAKRCAAVNVAATTRIVIGPPASCITEQAASTGSDLIVMGTHGRGGVAHFVLGSVAERVLRTAPCPVLTVRESSRAAETIAAEAVRKRHAVGA